MVMRGGNGAEEMTNLEEIEKRDIIGLDNLFWNDQRWLIDRVKKLEAALEEIKSKTITDPAHEVELRARAAYVFSIACKALEDS